MVTERRGVSILEWIGLVALTVVVLGVGIVGGIGLDEAMGGHGYLYAIIVFGLAVLAFCFGYFG